LTLNQGPGNKYDDTTTKTHHRLRRTFLPERLLAKSQRWVSFFSCPHSGGMGPLNLFTERFKISRFSSTARSGGRFPVKPLWLQLSTLNPANRPHPTGAGTSKPLTGSTHLGPWYCNSHSVAWGCVAAKVNADDEEPPPPLLLELLLLLLLLLEP